MVSVQALAAEYLSRKSSEQGKSNLIYEEKRCLASTSFRDGIKKQNMRKLHEKQSVLYGSVGNELDINQVHR